MKKPQPYILLSLISLSIGGFIYLLFRSKNLFMFQWARIIGIEHELDFIREKTDFFQASDWFRYSLPDGLWVFSYVNLMLIIRHNLINIHDWIWIFFIPLVGIGSEIGQFFSIIPGTFCAIDIIFYLVGSFTPFIIQKKTIQIL